MATRLSLTVQSAIGTGDLAGDFDVVRGLRLPEVGDFAVRDLLFEVFGGQQPGGDVALRRQELATGLPRVPLGHRLRRARGVVRDHEDLLARVDQRGDGLQGTVDEPRSALQNAIGIQKNDGVLLGRLSERNHIHTTDLFGWWVGVNRLRSAFSEHEEH